MSINNEKNESDPHCEEHEAHHCHCGHGDEDVLVFPNLSKQQLEMELKYNPNFVKEHEEAQREILKRYREIRNQKDS